MGTHLCKVEASVSSSSKEQELSLTRRDGPFFLAQSQVEYEDLGFFILTLRGPTPSQTGPRTSVGELLSEASTSAHDVLCI